MDPAGLPAQVASNGVIQGNGTLDIDAASQLVNNDGTISPGLSPGTLTINGDYEQQSGGRLVMEIGALLETKLIISSSPARRRWPARWSCASSTDLPRSRGTSLIFCKLVAR